MSFVVRLSTLFRGFAGLFLGGLEKNSPEALLANERENLRAQIAKYNSSLAAHAGNSERIRSLLAKQEALERKARTKLAQHLQTGAQVPGDDLAVRHQALTEEIASLRGELETAEATYTGLLKTRDVLVAAAKQKLTDLTHSVAELKTKRANAELNELAAGSVSEIGGSSDSLNRLEEIVTSDRLRSAGRSRAARDKLDDAGAETTPADSAPAAEAALADFAAEEGIPLGSASATTAKPEAARSEAMGPAAAPTAHQPERAPGSGKSMGPRPPN